MCPCHSIPSHFPPPKAQESPKVLTNPPCLTMICHHQLAVLVMIVAHTPCRIRCRNVPEDPIKLVTLLIIICLDILMSLPTFSVLSLLYVLASQPATVLHPVFLFPSTSTDICTSYSTCRYQSLPSIASNPLTVITDLPDTCSLAFAPSKSHFLSRLTLTSNAVYRSGVPACLSLSLVYLGR